MVDAPKEETGRLALMNRVVSLFVCIALILSGCLTTATDWQRVRFELRPGAKEARLVGVGLEPYVVVAGDHYVVEQRVVPMCSELDHAIPVTTDERSQTSREIVNGTFTLVSFLVGATLLTAWGIASEGRLDIDEDLLGYMAFGLGTISTGFSLISLPILPEIHTDTKIERRERPSDVTEPRWANSNVQACGGFDIPADLEISQGKRGRLEVSFARTSETLRYWLRSDSGDMLHVAAAREVEAVASACGVALVTPSVELQNVPRAAVDDSRLSFRTMLKGRPFAVHSDGISVKEQDPRLKTEDSRRLVGQCNKAAHDACLQKARSAANNECLARCLDESIDVVLCGFQKKDCLADRGTGCEPKHRDCLVRAGFGANAANPCVEACVSRAAASVCVKP